jgi:predicted nucleic acid-binding Zn ribbon protein
VRSDDGRDPQPVRASLDAVAARLGSPPTATLTAVFGRWNDIVGASVAGHCRPVSLVRGTLAIEVDDPAWATQLRFLSTAVLDRLDELVGADAVRQLEVRVRRR